MIERLQRRGVTAVAPANPLRGISFDSAYMASVLGQTPGPVVAVGHSYGGAVISNAATRRGQCRRPRLRRGLRARRGRACLARSRRGRRTACSTQALVPRQYPTADGGPAIEFSIDPAKAREAFAGDLSDEQAALIAAIQRPVAEAAFTEPIGPPAWKSLPSWAVVATGDKAAGTDVVRSMAERAGAKITEVEGSHVIMVSQPDAVANVILDAVAAVGAPVGAAG